MGARKILFLFALHLLTGLVVSQEVESKEAVKILNRIGGINRFVHCSVYCPGLDILVLFGGLSEDKTIVTEPEVFDFATETWSRPNSTGDQLPVAKRTCSLQLLEATTTDCNVILVQSNKDSEFLETAISTITSTTDGEFELEWHNVLAASTPVAPRGRGDFCATSFKGSVYVYGGVNVDSPAATESFMNEIWKLDIGTNTTSRVFSSTWNKLGVASDPNKPIPVKQCAIAYVGNKIVLQGGSGFEGVSNQVLSFDVGSQQWNAFPSPGSLDYLFSRALHSMVSYQGRVYSYGGYLLVPRRFSFDGVEYIYPTSLLSFTPIKNDMPQMDCRNADEKVDPKSALWCMYDESKGDLPVQDAIGASCVLRNSHMVCTTGVTTSTELSRGDEPRIIFFDLDIINKNLAIARERYAEAAGLVGSVYLFFAVICTISFIFWLMGMRDRQVATEMMNRQFPARANRGARASVVAKIPLVEWQGEGTQPTPVVSENADDNGTSNTPASGITSHTPTSSSEALEVTEIRVINQGEEDQIPVAENGESFEEYREMCSICLMEFEVGEHLRQLPCKHLFHPTCVDQWLTADKSCPLCKQDIDKLPGLRTPSMESINPSFSDADVETMQDGHGLLLSNTDRRWRNPMPNIRNPFRRQAAESGVTSPAM